jgi:hypothetical protein
MVLFKRKDVEEEEEEEEALLTIMAHICCSCGFIWQ